MDIFEPEYYSKFHCLAGSCPDSCCQEWAVDVDADSAGFYRSLPGNLGDRLRSVLQDTEDGTIMTIENRRCPMWRQDGLCQIQAELGHDALCKTCRDFPRLRHDYGSFVELGLELSCPEAARLIFESASSQLLKRSAPGGERGEYEQEVMDSLLESRRTILDFIDGATYSLPESLAILLLYGHYVQAEIDGGEKAVFDAEKYLQQARHLPLSSPDYSDLIAFFEDLEILTPRWKKLLQSANVVPCSDALRPFVRYLIQRYWLQAVADYDLLCRVKFIVVACLLISGLDGEPVQTAQLFSKEIENDPDNVDAVLDGAYTYPAFADIALLSLLLK
jgi:lysine-N-methylase